MPPCAVCRKPIAHLYPLPTPSGEPPPLVCRKCYRAATGEPPDAAVIRWAMAPAAPVPGSPEDGDEE